MQFQLVCFRCFSYVVCNCIGFRLPLPQFQLRVSHDNQAVSASYSCYTTQVPFRSYDYPAAQSLRWKKYVATLKLFGETLDRLRIHILQVINIGHKGCRNQIVLKGMLSFRNLENSKQNFWSFLSGFDEIIIA